MIEKLNPDSQVVAKINELVAHINILEQKLLSAEEREEAEDIRLAVEAIKRNKFIDFKEVEEELGPGIQIN